MEKSNSEQKMTSAEIVRLVSVKIRKSRASVGSGLFFDPGTSDFVYIVTARHCLVTGSLKNPRVSSFILEFNQTKAKKRKSYKLQAGDVLEFDVAEDPDLAMFKIPREHLAGFKLPSVKLGSYHAVIGDCSISGYPNYTANEHLRLVKTSNNGYDPETDLIQVNYLSGFEDQDGLAEDNTKGFSGSPLCLELKDGPVFFGIVTDSEVAGKSFLCVGFDEWLSKHLPQYKLLDTELESLLPGSLFTGNINASTKLLGGRYSKTFTFPPKIMDAFSNIFLDQDYRLSYEPARLVVLDKYLKYLSIKNSLSRAARADLFGLKVKVNNYDGRPPSQETMENQLLVMENALSRFMEHLQDKSVSNLDMELLDNTAATVQRYTLWNNNVISDSKLLLKKHGPELREVNSGINEFGLAFQEFWRSFLEIQENINRPFLIVDGKAGAGKSHLVAEIANRKSNEHKPVLLFLGQNFERIEDPMKSIIGALGLDLDEQVFLNLLSRKAQIAGERLVIFIDAMNEGRGILIWKRYLKEFAEKFLPYKNLGLVFTYRSNAANILGDQISGELFRTVTHYGFAGQENEALIAFCKEHKLPNPRFPALSSEFANPLFLKLICKGQSLRYGSLHFTGVQGILRTFDYYINFVNEKLAADCGYESYKINLVKKVISRYIETLMEQESYDLEYQEAFLLCADVTRYFSSKTDYLDRLVSEEIFLEKHLDVDHDDTLIKIDFGYQRMGEHLVAQFLLNREDRDSIRSSFKPGGRIFRFVWDEQTLNRNQGLVEAIATQLPEKFGLEIFEVSGNIRFFQPAVTAFIGSLKWRKTQIERDKLLIYFNEIREHKPGYLGYFWDGMLDSAAQIDLAMNAAFMHSVLKGLSMADRDQYWTIYLADSFDKDESHVTVVRKLLDWGWKDYLVEQATAETIVLTGVAIGWLFTATNVRLRDYATKTMVRIFEDRPKLFLYLLKQFQGVNDPYVVQRIYAAAFGIVVRNQKVEDTVPIAEYIYQHFFDVETVYPDILTRDYAMGVIEYSSYLGGENNWDMEKVRPPYKSKMFEHIPSNAEIDALKFGYYSPSDEFVTAANRKILSSMVTEYGRGTSNYGDFGRYTFESAIDYWTDIDANEMSNLAIWMIFTQYKYDGLKFGRFDSGISNQRIGYGQVERIGKKYQWIAFYELLARIADNKQFSAESWTTSTTTYKGTWEPFVRDIDPTVIRSPEPLKVPEKAWWKQPTYQKWNMSDMKWLAEDKNFPSLIDLIERIDGGGDPWIMLQGYPRWVDLKMKGFGEPTKEIWYQIRSYLVAEEDYQTVTEWLEGKDFMGRWMPENRESHTFFSREYFWNPAIYQPEEGQDKGWMSIDSSDSPDVQIMPTAVEFLWERDREITDELSSTFLKPARLIFDQMHLKYSKTEGQLVDASGLLFAIDPAAVHDVESSLFIRKREFLATLKKLKLKVFWTVLGEKRIMQSQDKDNRVREISALATIGASGLKTRIVMKYN